MKSRLANLVRLAPALFVAVLSIALQLRLMAASPATVAETKQILRQQGFKTDLTNFDFSTSPELRTREAAINATAPDRNTAPFFDHPNLLEPTASNQVVTVWLQDFLRRRSPAYPDNSYELTWADFRQAVNQRKPQIDAACDAILSGPVQFNLNAAAGNAMLLPHLAILKELTQTLNDRAMIALHDGNRAAAWTNLLAATRLVTAWNVEPAEISHLVQFADAQLVFDATWQLLQTNGWTDDQLVRLQHEWKSVDFFADLPDVQAFRRASDAKAYEHDELKSQGPRSQLSQPPPPSFTEFVDEFMRNPFSLWQQSHYQWSRRAYSRGGMYEDEQRLLLFYRDREVEFRHAIQASTWMQMRQMPGVTNEVFFQPKYPYYGLFAMSLNQRRMNARFQNEGVSLLGRAAEAETERRIIIIALVLERYREKNGAYPESLQALAPEFVQSVPLDFMNGQPLHYRVTSDRHFLLYSVGLDCVDNGGKIQTPPTEEERNAFAMNRNLPVPQSDIVWPLPASSAQVTALRANQSQEFAAQMAAVEARGRAAAEQGEQLRQQTIKDWLALEPPFVTNAPVVEGRPLARILQNTSTTGNTPLSWDALLTPKKIITGEEPDMATYEVPVNYDALKDKGDLKLLVDGQIGGSFQECDRATNGDCLLVWNTTYDPPGQHALRADLFYYGLSVDETELQGPVTPYYSTNLLQFDELSSVFTEKGATLYAKTAELHAVYSIELKTVDGKHLKTLTGATTNGIIDVRWDLRDDNGKKFTNNSFESVFNVTLPDSGRSQTVK